MAQIQSRQPKRLLTQQVRWLVGLRWFAGLAVIVGSLTDLLWLGWYVQAPKMVAVGLLILAYNVALKARVRDRGEKAPSHKPIVWLHILPDLACLAVLTAWTDGEHSPVLGFFVFHMVFTSMLFRPAHAYAVAVCACVMVILCLWATGTWPSAMPHYLVLIGWGVTLLVTVFLTNHIMSALRRHRRRLMAKNRHVRALAKRLRVQQQAMIQQEKMVGLGQMAAGVAHEVSNPLASMDSVLQLMQRNQKHVKPENLDTLRQQVQRIKETVRQLTDFAHPTDYNWQKVPINSVIESALQMVRFDHRQRGVDMQVQLDPDNPTIQVQPHALQQVLTNLLFNALDALDGVTGPRITLGARVDDQECRLWISDNGPGIAPEHLKRVFEPFYTTKPVGKGTGLGLAISYNLIRNHGGRIEFDSPPGQGVTATIHLPKLRPV